MIKYYTLFGFLITTSILFSQNQNVQFRSQLQFPGQTCANIGGYVDTSGKEYALVCGSNGLIIVDVTNPVTPQQKIQIPGPNKLWREVKTYKGFAYVTNEADSGLQIIDLNGLPNLTLPNKFWKGSGAIAGQLKTIHALHIDTTKGFAYLYGSNLANGGPIVVDLSSPWNPVYVGEYNAHYVHDGYVDNDTLYACEIYQGKCEVINFANKANPQPLQNWSTPGSFTHNSWISDNRKVIYTTDEVNNSYLVAYDISNLSNVKELDRIQSNPGSQSIVHNVHILNDYAVSSWYKDGFTIVDAHRPTNLVQVGNYDTFSGSGGGFDGAWGVYPYLPSGNIVITNINDGLFVLTPTYKRACYLEGTVVDSATGSPLFNAQVDITTVLTDKTKINGTYATGTPTQGVYTVQVSKLGYITKTISSVTLTPGAVNVLNATLTPLPSTTYTATVYDLNTGQPIANAPVRLVNSSFDYAVVTNTNGVANFTNVKIDNYTAIAGKWGYVTECTGVILTQTTAPVSFSLAPGYNDDFGVDLGWTVSGNAVSGIWERDKPLGTTFGLVQANPPGDANLFDCYDDAYVTGNSGVASGDDDIDNGNTILTSPVFDLTAYSNPQISFYRWFFNDGGSGSPNDSLKVYISNGTTTALVQAFTAASPANSTWDYFSFPVKSYVTLTNTMTLKLEAMDASPGHLVEAGIDNFDIGDVIQPGVPAVSSENKSYIKQFISSDDLLHIGYRTSNTVDEVYLQLMDITGKVLVQRNMSSNAGIIELPNYTLSKGLYVVKLMTDKEVLAVGKIIN